MANEGLKLTVYYIHIVQIVDSAIPVHYRRLGIAAHAARSGLVLNSANTAPGDGLPGRNRASFLEPLFAPGCDEFSHFYIMRMAMAADAQAGNAPVVFQIRHELHAALKYRHLLHRAHHSHRAFVVLPYETLVFEANAELEVEPFSNINRADE